MTLLIGEFNKDQFDGLAKLCFELAKGGFAIVLFTTSSIKENFVIGILKIFISLILAFAFTYLALVLLKIKESVK